MAPAKSRYFPISKQLRPEACSTIAACSQTGPPSVLLCPCSSNAATATAATTQEMKTYHVGLRLAVVTVTLGGAIGWLEVRWQRVLDGGCHVGGFWSGF